MAIELVTVVVQRWEESERGWGVRPDGYTIHLSTVDHRRYVDDYYKRNNSEKEVPDEYTRTAGNPEPMAILKGGVFDRQLMENQQEGGCGIWGHPSSWPVTTKDGYLVEPVDTGAPKVVEPAKPDEELELQKSERPFETVVFWVGRNVKPFTAKTIETEGAGGAERALAEIAGRLADECEVIVYVEGLPDTVEEVFYGGVKWRNAHFIITPEAPYVFVTWRNVESLFRNTRKDVRDLMYNASKRILWMHDPCVSGYVICPWETHYEHIVCVSNWHRHYFLSRHHIPESKVVTIPNGLDPLDFKEVPVWKKKPRRVIYASSPMRGLEELLSVWPTIAWRVKDAELHVYYGFEDWIALGGGDKAKRLQRTLGEMASKGVTNHGRVPPSKMIEEFYKGRVLAYPSTYPETFCLTALEAQAAGCIPVVSSLGALPETVLTGEILDGEMETWLQTGFVDAVVDRLLDDDLQKKSTQAHERAKEITWDKAAEAWLSLINSLTRETAF